MSLKRNEVVTRTLVSAGSVGMLALALSLLSPQSGISQTAAQDVKVVNTNTEAVPVRVQGTAGVTGAVRIDPRANVVKLDPEANVVSARQSGNWAVRIANPAPIPVVDVTERARVPYSARLLLFAGPGLFANSKAAPAPGPGRRLVVETVTVQCSGPSSQVHGVSIRMAQTNGGVGTEEYEIALTPAGVVNTQTFFTATHNVRLYCDSEHLPRVTLKRSGSTQGQILGSVSLSGYTEPE